MSLRTVTAALFFALVLTGSWTPAGAAGAPKCQSIRVRSAEDGSPRGVEPRFSAVRILDLEIEVLFPPTLLGEHELRLELRTPNGHLYESRIVPFSTDRGKAGSLRRVRDYPRPLEVAVAQPVEVATPAPDGPVTEASSAAALTEAGAAARRRLGVSTTFPVAGTMITSSSLYGRWRVDAFVDGETEACGSKRFFILE